MTYLIPFKCLHSYRNERTFSMNPGRGFFLPFLLVIVCGTVTTPVFAGVMHRWTDSTGEHQFNAELINVADGKATLKKQRSNEIVTVPLTRLSAGDVQYLKHWSDPAKRQALEKFEDIGDVQCDTDGAIELGLSQSGCTDNDLKLVVALPEVISIDLFECPISDAGLQVLTELKKLQVLHLRETDVKGPGFEHLPAMQSLTDFQYSLDDYTLPPIAQFLPPLGKLNKLKKLSIRHCGVSAEGLKTIGRLTNLESLEIYDGRINSPALENISGLTKLRELKLAGAHIDDADLAHLEGMTELQTLELNDAEFTNKGMQHVAQLKNLTRLELPRRLHNGDLRYLAGLTKLTWLRIDGDHVGDAGLAHIAGLVNLQFLSLPENVTGAGLKHLDNLTRLKELQYDGDKVPFSQAMSWLIDRQGRSVNEALSVLVYRDPSESGSEWKSLSLDFRPRADRESLKYLVELPALEGLVLGEDTTDAWLESLVQIKRLNYFQVLGDRGGEHPVRFSAVGMKHLAECRNIEHLEFYDCDLGAAALVEISTLPKLKHLRLSECKLAPGNTAALSKMKVLESLYITDTNFTDADIGAIADLQNLENVSVPEGVTLQGLVPLKNLKNLRYVSSPRWSEFGFTPLLEMFTRQFGRSHAEALGMIMTVQRNDAGKVVVLRWPYDMNGTAEELAFLSDMHALETLVLPPEVTDEALGHIARLKNLTSLRIDSEHITNAGLSHLAGLTNLEYLYISRAPVTDDALQHIAKLKKLKTISFHRSKVTAAGIAKLQQALPKASIRR